VTGFSDTFTSEWSGTPVYGRMDDLYTFERTGRKLSLAFDVVASDTFEAAKNMKKLNQLAQFLYPVYSQPQGDLSVGANSQTLKAAPLLKLKWNGLVSNALDGADLVGFVNGFTYAPDLSEGQFFVTGRGSGKPYIAPQAHNVQLEYTVLHTHLTGWTTRALDLGGGVSKYIFGEDEKKNIGELFPHAVSDPMAPPNQEASSTATPSATEDEKDDDAMGMPGDGQDSTTPNEIAGSLLQRLLSDSAEAEEVTDIYLAGLAGEEEPE